MGTLRITYKHPRDPDGVLSKLLQHSVARRTQHRRRKRVGGESVLDTVTVIVGLKSFYHAGAG